MKQVIVSKIYNTETAEEIHSWSNGLGSGDFNSLSETLYMTKKGAFFLHGDGGAMTCWARGNGNSQWGSEGIQPMSKAEAVEWLEQHDGSEALLEHEAFKSAVTEA